MFDAIQSKDEAVEAVAENVACVLSRNICSQIAKKRVSGERK